MGFGPQDAAGMRAGHKRWPWHPCVKVGTLRIRPVLAPAWGGCSRGSGPWIGWTWGKGARKSRKRMCAGLQATDPRHGPDSGLTGLTGDAGHEFRVSFSFVATGLQASSVRGGLEDVEGAVSDGGLVGGATSGAGPGLVLAEGDVGHPVEAVPDRPMAVDGPGARLRCHRPGRDTDAYGAGQPGFFPKSRS